MDQTPPEGTHIRRALSADAAAVRDLTRSAYAKWVPLIGREPVPMAADHDRAVREHMVDLLFIGAELVALIETVRGANHLLIENVAVSPPFLSRPCRTATCSRFLACPGELRGRGSSRCPSPPTCR